ncbi:MAG TPA: Zn-dependent hydrolase [Desulfobulbaceae bacterium]|nr:Zn-dependent hydrolase [Desulfobulbaceae bacterium]
MIKKKINEYITVINTKSGSLPFYRLDIWLYIVDGVLIDAGSNNILNKIKFPLQQEKIDCAAITHIHEDHTGAAAWIKNNLKIPVYVAVNSIDEAATKTNLPFYRKVVWGNREAFVANPMPSRIETKNFSLDVIAAPGHHKDHVVFYEKSNGWLFSGDVYVSRKQKVALTDENIGDAIKTLNRLVQLDIGKIFCAHTGIHIGGKEKLQSKLDFFLNIQNQVNTLKKEGLALKEIDKRLFPKKNLWTICSGGEWSSLNLVRTI